LVDVGFCSKVFGVAEAPCSGDASGHIFVIDLHGVNLFGVAGYWSLSSFWFYRFKFG